MYAATAAATCASEGPAPGTPSLPAAGGFACRYCATAADTTPTDGGGPAGAGCASRYAATAVATCASDGPGPCGPVAPCSMIVCGGGGTGSIPCCRNCDSAIDNPVDKFPTTLSCDTCCARSESNSDAAVDTFNSRKTVNAANTTAPSASVAPHHRGALT